MADYYGKSEFEKHGELVHKLLLGRAITKRKDCADQVGGIRHEAGMLCMSTIELIRTIEGLCYNGMAYEVMDGVYVIGTPAELKQYGVDLEEYGIKS